MDAVSLATSKQRSSNADVHFQTGQSGCKMISCAAIISKNKPNDKKRRQPRLCRRGTQVMVASPHSRKLVRPIQSGPGKEHNLKGMY